MRFVEPLTLSPWHVATLGLLYLVVRSSVDRRGCVGIPASGRVCPRHSRDTVEGRADAYTPGAHDNAASVAVALEVGTRLAAQPLDRTEVWLAFTGAEETDHAGLYALLRRRNPSLRDAVFVGLEGLGSGELVYLTRQGVCAHYTPDPELQTLAAEIAAQRPELCAKAAQMTGEDEVGTLRRKGYRAICIAGRDPESGTLPHWHRPDDTADTVSAEFMGRAADLVTALLHALDRQALNEQEEP